jgi:hypothetical protein
LFRDEEVTVVENVYSKLLETTRHATKQRDAFFARARSANRAWANETQRAGLEIVDFVRDEAKSWRRFLVQQASRFGTDVRLVFSPRGWEQRLLTGVDGTLVAIDSRVKGRLASLEAPKKRAKRANGVAKKKGAARVKSAKPVHVATALAGGAARH